MSTLPLVYVYCGNIKNIVCLYLYLCGVRSVRHLKLKKDLHLINLQMIFFMSYDFISITMCPLFLVKQEMDSSDRIEGPAFFLSAWHLWYLINEEPSIRKQWE